MEKIAKLLICSFFIISCKSYAQLPEYITSLEEVETQYGQNKVVNYYSVEVPMPSERSTRSLESAGIDANVLNVMFFSEVDDTFSFYINGELKQTVYEDTTIKTSGTIEQAIFQFPYPTGETTAILKVISSKYGGFETEIKKEYPMLYLKYNNREWYLLHNTVFYIDIDRYFLEDNKKLNRN